MLHIAPGRPGAHPLTGSGPQAPRDNAASMLFATAAREGARPAIVDGGEAVGYDELAARARGIATALLERGLKPGDRVCIMLRRGVDAAAGFFGVLAAGGVAVMAYDGLKPRQLEYVLAHSGARALLTSERGDRSELVVLDPATLATDGTLEPVPRIERDVAQIIYTSGSTGQPKGVTLSHGNVWAGMSAVVSYVGITREDRVASLLPFSFDYGLNQLLCSMATGATLVLERSPVPHRVVASLRRHDVTVLPAVPPLWLQLLTVPSFANEPLPELRAMTNTGGRLPTHAVRRLRACQPQAELFLMYGLTEAFRSTYLPPDETDVKPDSIGRAIPGAEILVLREDLSPCEPGEVGQLVHRGPTVALGYWNDPEATARTYRPNPLRPPGTPDVERVVFSGDLVRKDESGALYFVGRADKMIKSMGYRVGPDEVVDVLVASGQVTEAIVAGEPDEARGELIVAYVVLAENGSVEELEAYCKRELPSYMQPGRFEVRSQLRRTSSGKHDTAATVSDRPS